jgi:ketosteroid isomerase-like protein
MATATTPEDNIAVVRRLFELFLTGGPEAAMDLVSPDIEWVEPPESPDQHIVQGRTAAAAAVSAWIDTWSDYEIEMRDVIAEGDSVIAVLYQRAKVGELPVESFVFMVWGFEDGVPARMHMHLDRERAFADAGMVSRPA